MLVVDWSDFKAFVDARFLSVQYVDLGNKYYLLAIDSHFSLECYLNKTNDASDVTDFENNYKAAGNKKIDPKDEDTGGVSFSPKYAVDGWTEQMFELELETSKLNSIHEKDIDNVDLGFASLKFYKDVSGTETEWTPADQADLDVNCIRTDLLWMPTYDYMIKGGWVSQIVTPTNNVYVWAVGADLDAAYGGPQTVFVDGGLNLAFSEPLTLMGLNGVAATRLNYSHPILGDGKGTNRIRFIFRHPAGFKHRAQCVFDIFKG